ncbi:MAG: UDP-N-acetylmuramate dehydrogenase [Actinomycetota bacterium]
MTGGGAPALARLADRDRRLRVEFDAPLGERTTYRVGGTALALVHVDDPDALPLVAEAAHLDGLPVMTLGRGSNMLVADAGFPGVALVLGAFAERVALPPTGAEPLVAAGASVVLPALARRLVHAGLRGMEWSVGVPGSVGGAVRMNAGGHGSDMATNLRSADVVDLVGGVRRRWTPGELGLGFRHSGLGDRHVVVSAELGLVWGDPSAGRAELEAVVAWRRSHQPGGQNCGSVFVNPVPGEVAAGALIDSLGLRGFRIGSAEVSTKHANFIQADPGGSADDVMAVMSHVRDAVLSATGFELRTEVRLIGFDHSDTDPGER